METVDESTDEDMVIPTYHAPKDPSKYTETEKEKFSMDNGLQLILIESLDNIMYNNIISRDTTKQIWEKIEIMCEGTEEKLHDKYYEAEVDLKFLLALPDHLEHKISAIRERRDLSRITLKILYGILKTYELEMLQRKSIKANYGYVVDGSSALVVNDSEASEDEQDAQVPISQVVEQKNKGPQKQVILELEGDEKPKKVKKDKAYLESEVKYEALLKKQQRKAYIAEGKSWDDTDDEDENEDLGNYALMDLEQEESSSSKSEVPTLTTIDLNTSQYK
ncbi:hypothetical protein AgCh_034883 [Apium graveolens]